jgi:hypothetical protein
MTQAENVHPRVPLSLFPILLILISAFAVPLRAEDSSNGGSDISIQKPRIFVGGHLGLNFPNASSDIFHMVTRELTLEKSDFRQTMGGFDVGVPFHPHFAAVFSFDYGRTSPYSESRDFVDEFGDPITQKTTFSLMPITGTLRFYPRKMGETVGSYAYVPTRVLPYVGGGFGVVHYDFEQTGSFVDRETLNIFSASFESDGTPWTTHVVTGVDIGLSSRIFANVEARYSWAEADLSEDFIGFEPIDLSGLRVVAGIYFRF